MNKIKNKHGFDWHYTRWGGIFAVHCVKIWARFARKTTYTVKLSRPLERSDSIVIAANHQTLLDPPAAFAALSFKNLRMISPVKFMTWHKYYNSGYKLPLYTVGCYPSHGDGLTGVDGAVHYASRGYRSFIFPEGKRTNPNRRGAPYDGVTQILSKLPADARLLLIHIDWEPRAKLLSRPRLSVTISDAPKKLNTDNPVVIMNAIYRL